MKKVILIFLCALLVGRLSAQQSAEAFPMSGTSAALSAGNIVKTANTEDGQEVDEDDWHNKFIYLGLSLLWIPKIYSDLSYNNIASVGVEFKAEIHPLRFLSVRTGVEMSQDLMVINSSEIITDMILDFPLSVAYVFSPLQGIMLEPYFGVNYNLSLQSTTEPYFLSWNVGVELAIKTGLGIITIEPRFARDIGSSYLLSTSSKETLEYTRSIIHLGVGFKVGINKRFF